jgi:hypothetical protein
MRYKRVKNTYEQGNTRRVQFLQQPSIGALMDR